MSVLMVQVLRWKADIAMMRALPNVRVFSPADYNQAIQMVSAMAESHDVDYIRVTRADFPVFLDPDISCRTRQSSEIARWKRYHPHCYWFYGIWISPSRSDAYRGGKSVEVLNIHTIKPIDRESIISFSTEDRQSSRYGRA
jgi:transketolase